MKRIIRQCSGLAAAAFLFSAVWANAGLTGNVNDFLFKRTAHKVIESYTDNTVVKTIILLRENVEGLNEAAQKFAETRSQKDLEAMGSAMKGSFEQFNKARIFRYGPSAFYDFDKQLATWPPDKVMADHNIKEIEAGRMELDLAEFRYVNSSNRGLHTVKHLIFHNDGKLREPAEISDAAAAYLTAVTAVMLEEAIDYQSSWVGTRNMTAADQAILKNAGKRIHTSYAEEFKNPGDETSRYFSISIPLQELAGESMAVLEDMVALIEELPRYGNIDEIRYWDSVTPFDDIINQLKGVENSMVGGVEDSRGTSFIELLAKRDEPLSERILISMAHSIKRAQVARRMNDQPLEKREKAAELLLHEVEKLTVMIMAATPLVCADAAVDPFAAYGSNL